MAPNGGTRVIFRILAFALIADHVARRPWQVIAALGALIFGVGTMTALATADRAVVENANLAVARVAPDVNLQISATAPITDNLLRIVSRTHGMIAARAVIERSVTFETAVHDRLDAHLVGINLLSPVLVDEAARTALLPGPYAPRGADATTAEIAIGQSVVIDQRFSDRARVGIGDRLIMRLGAAYRTVRVIAVLHDDEIGTSDALVFADIDNAQRWFGLVGRFDRIDCVVEPGQLDRVQRALRRFLPAFVRIAEPQARTQRIIESTSGITFALRTIAVFAGILAALAAYNLFGTAVVQRRDTVATLRSLGVARGELLRTIVFEAAMYGIIGSLAGLLCGMLFVEFSLARAMALADPQATGTPAVVEGGSAAVLMVSGIIGTVVAAIIPAFRGLSREIRAVREDPFERRRSSRGSFAGAVLAIAVAIGAALVARWTSDDRFLVLGFAALAFVGALASPPLASFVLRVLGNRAPDRAGIRIAASLAHAHAGRASFVALPIVAAVSALSLVTVLVASDGATFDTATRAVFGVDAVAIRHAFDLTYALLGGTVVILIVVSAIAIGSVWFSALLERRAAYATLRSLGMDDRDVVFSIGWEVGMLAALSATLSLLVTAADFALVALSTIRVVAGSAVWLIPLGAIALWTISIAVIACLSAFPGALIVSRGTLHRVTGA